MVLFSIKHSIQCALLFHPRIFMPYGLLDSSTRSLLLQRHSSSSSKKVRRRLFLIGFSKVFQESFSLSDSLEIVL